MARPPSGELPAGGRRKAREGGPPLRLGIVFFSNGVEPAHWWAKGSGATMELGPGLAPMMPHREDMVFIRGLFNQSAFVSTSPHLGRMNLLSGAPVSLDPERDPRRHDDGPGRSPTQSATRPPSRASCSASSRTSCASKTGCR